jgi:hypothetical protein
MSSVDTLIGNDFRFAIATPGTSPPEFVDMCAVIDPGSIGEEKPLIDVTSLCDTIRVYRGGLPDGVEIALVANYTSGDPQLKQLYDLYRTGDDNEFRLYVYGVSPPEYFQFNAIVRAWNVSVPNGDKSSMTFTLKVVANEEGEGVQWVQAA